ncbi:VOC family protein [Aliiglaciecola sp. 3_MG-2023]|uniref:VOC family protein n=1 Tax=Aliiglaciecola sp. 3_MG-2023 TaxID=3062644 RepID=UPI0026E37D9F|nr:VOC family protein [Aliiglaciecola sp. 3_MG-2023]MDO6693276.1 VOC family protein [Aliiglaciecola sp. 3_MG-2023]
MSTAPIGSVVWTDLTVKNADDVKAFYAQVIGWQANPVSMGDYDDYSMQLPSNNQDVVGICHAKGDNAGLPAQWLLYFKVANLDESIAQTEAGGGKLLSKIKHYGSQSRYIIIQDPAGAVCALFEENT